MRLKTRFLLLALLIFSSADCFGEQLLMSRPRSSNEVDRSKFYDYKSRRKEKKENALSLRHQNYSEKTHKYWTAIVYPVNYNRHYYNTGRYPVYRTRSVFYIEMNISRR
jgi:hypothetical protein